MVEEKVEELDKKVKRYNARQPQFDQLSFFEGSPASSDSDVLMSSVIDFSEQRITFVLDDVDDDEIELFQVDAEGDPVGKDVLLAPPETPIIGSGTNTDTFHQLSISPQGDIDVLTSVETESGPVGVLFRKPGNNIVFNKSGFPRFFAGNNTTVEVSSFTYDSQGNIYVGGDSGIFSIEPDPFARNDTPNINRWNKKYFKEFQVPKEGLVAQGDSIFVVSHKRPTNDIDTVILTAMNADSSIAWSDTVVNNLPPVGTTTNYNSKIHLLTDENHLYMHYQQDRSGTDAIFKYTYDDGSRTRGTFDLSGSNAHFHPTIVSSGSMIFGGSKGGTVVKINGNSLNSGFVSKNNLSDSRVEVNLLSNSSELLVGTLEGDSGALYKLNSQNLTEDPELVAGDADTAPHTLPDDRPFNRGQLPRAVWLKEDGVSGFLGVTFYGTSIFWRDITTGTKLQAGPWPHEDANNQRQRRKQ
jgi:hypothetical protein